MTNFDMYNIVSDYLGKDQKGGVNVEEFENLLKARSLWMFQHLLSLDGATKRHSEALSPFKVVNETQTASSHIVTPTNAMSHFISGKAAANGGDTYYPIDVVTLEEFRDRESDALTQPTTENPVAFLSDDADVMKAYVYPNADADSYIDYYKSPTEPYLDYYVDANANVQYLTENQAEYTLQTGEVARDGSVATEGVTSATAEIEWRDTEKIVLTNYILKDMGVLLGDQAMTQLAAFEEQNTEIK